MNVFPGSLSKHESNGFEGRVNFVLDCRQNSDKYLEVNIRLLIHFAAGGHDNILLSSLFATVYIRFLHTVGLCCP